MGGYDTHVGFLTLRAPTGAQPLTFTASEGDFYFTGGKVDKGLRVEIHVSRIKPCKPLDGVAHE